MHRGLDESHGACPFRDPMAREIVAATLHHGDGADYAFDAFVVMPNHVHVLICPHSDAELSAITKKWKSVTAHRVNQLLSRTGSLWQHESWDHIVRSPEHLERYRRYIESNPERLPK
jgi:putative transposase